MSVNTIFYIVQLAGLVLVKTSIMAILYGNFIVEVLVSVRKSEDRMFGSIRNIKNLNVIL